jgi:serine protease Do
VVGGLVGTFAAIPILRGGPSTPPAIPKELTSYRDVVKKVLPAVVSIESKAKPVARVKSPSKRRGPSFDESQVPEEFRKFFREFPNLPEMPNEQPNESPYLGMGSGFIVDPKGVIVTNYHVVDGADEVEVHLKDGRKFTSKDIKSDPKTDLAIVRIDAKSPLPYLEFGDSKAMEIGDRVLAVGAPFGLTGSVTAGIISAKGRDLHMNLYEDFLQTDAAINPGNSGGPLVNLDGQVIGIDSAIKSRSGGWQGVGLAISSNLAKNVMEQLSKNGVVHRGYLGVQIKDLDNAELAKRLGVGEEGGVLVAHVYKSSPGAKAGLKDGDVITQLNGKPVKEGHELQQIVAGLPLNKPVDMTVVRDGKTQTLHVTIEEQPQKFGLAREEETPRAPRTESAAASLDQLGMEVADLTPELAEKLGYKSSETGVVITQVDQGGVASEAGLTRGTLIVKVDKKPVKTAAELQEGLNKGALTHGALLQVQTPQGGTNFVLLKVTAAAAASK